MILNQNFSDPRGNRPLKVYLAPKECYKKSLLPPKPENREGQLISIPKQNVLLKRVHRYHF